MGFDIARLAVGAVRLGDAWVGIVGVVVGDGDFIGGAVVA